MHIKEIFEAYIGGATNVKFGTRSRHSVTQMYWTIQQFITWSYIEVMKKAY